MAIQFTTDGIAVDTYDDIYNRLATGLRAIYGNDINLDSDSPDGQRLGLITKELLDLQSFGALLYSNLDIDFTFGSFLDVLNKLAGLTRNPSTRSQVDVTVVTDRDLTLATNYTIQGNDGTNWIVTADQAVTTGSNTVTFFSQQFGEFEALPGTITTPSTIVLGVTSVTNPAAATAGVNEETDVELRARRRQSLGLPAFSSVASGIARIGDLAGVTDVVAYENDTPDQDTVRDIRPHTVWYIVEGGDLAQIAEALVRNKTAGAGFKGSVTAIYNETVARPTGGNYTIRHSINIDRPRAIDLHIRMNATTNDQGGTVDQTAIKNALAARTYIIAEDAIASSLYATAYGAGSNFILTDLEISTNGTTYVANSLDAAYDGKFSIDVANIDITVS